MSKLKNRHAISIGVLFSIGSIIINMGYNEEYLLQKLFISFLVSTLLIVFYQYLLNKNPNKNLYQIINEKLNNTFGKIIILSILILLLFCSVQIIYSFIDFITTINQLDFLSKNMIMLLNFILLGYILKNSIYDLGRFTQVIFVLTIAMIFLLFLLGIKDINYKNLLPFYSVRKNDFLNNLHVFVVQPFLEVTFLFNVFSKLESSKIKNNIFFIVNGISFLFLFLISIETVGILGDNYTSFLNFPYYVSISCINVSKIVIRIEAISLIVFYFSSFVKLLFVTNSFILGLCSITKSHAKHYYPYLLTIHILSLIMYDNLGELKQFEILFHIIYYSIYNNSFFNINKKR